MTTPYLGASGAPTVNSGLSFVNPGALRHYVAALSAEGFQVHVHAIGDRAVREASTRSPRPPAPICATTSPTSRWSTPTTCRASRPGRGQHPGALGLPATSRWSSSRCPSSVRSAARGSTRSAICTARRRRLVAGSDWPVDQPDPLAAIHTAVNRTTYGEAGRRGREPFLPEQAISLERPSPPTRRLLVDQPPRRRRGARGPGAARPRACSIATASPVRRSRSARPAGLDVDGRMAGLRSLNPPE